MQIGDLDRRVELHNPTTTANNYGELTVTYALYTTRWAHILWKGGDTGEEQDRVSGSSKIHFYLRNQDLGSLTTETKVVYDGKTYFISTLNEIDGRQGIKEIIGEYKD